MKDFVVSIITVCYNSADTLSDTIESVLNQTYHSIEYIIIDGGSTDKTQELVSSYGDKISKFISEPDEGIYSAINKGIRLSSGDIVGILNSDDFFTSAQVIEKVVKSFTDNDIDAVYGDALFVDPLNTSKAIRFYSSKKFKINKFRYGFMPAHPTFYVRRNLFEKFGYYKTDYKIAADFELLLRYLYINNVRCQYIEMIFLSMRMGGVSNKSARSKFILNKEIARACRENGISTNYFFLYFKYFIKMFEFTGHSVHVKTVPE